MKNKFKRGFYWSLVFFIVYSLSWLLIFDFSDYSVDYAYQKQVRKAKVIKYSARKHKPAFFYENIKFQLSSGSGYRFIYFCMPPEIIKSVSGSLLISIFDDANVIEMKGGGHVFNEEDLKKYNNIDLSRSIDFSDSYLTDPKTHFYKRYTISSTIFYATYTGVYDIDILEDSVEPGICEASILAIIENATPILDPFSQKSIFEKIAYIFYFFSAAYLFLSLIFTIIYLIVMGIFEGISIAIRKK